LYKSPHIREFSKNSSNYKSYNFLQKKIAKELLGKIDFKPKNILDIGCGDGVVFSLIDWEIEKFVGLDFSKMMLKNHPKNENITLLEMDFDLLDGDFFKEFDMVVSSSALQWSKDPYTFMKLLEKSSKSFAVSVFCDKTFSSLRKFLGIDTTFLPDSNKFFSLFSSDIMIEKKYFKLSFEDNLSMLRYIKKSGVSGGIKKATVKSIRNFINSYDKKELEFEVVFMIKTPQTHHNKTQNL